MSQTVVLLTITPAHALRLVESLTRVLIHENGTDGILIRVEDNGNLLVNDNLSATARTVTPFIR